MSCLERGANIQRSRLLLRDVSRHNEDGALGVDAALTGPRMIGSRGRNFDRRGPLGSMNRAPGRAGKDTPECDQIFRVWNFNAEVVSSFPLSVSSLSSYTHAQPLLRLMRSLFIDSSPTIDKCAATFPSGDLHSSHSCVCAVKNVSHLSLDYHSAWIPLRIQQRKSILMNNHHSCSHEKLCPYVVLFKVASTLLFTYIKYLL
jgi:hypothetical protein